MFNIKNSVVVFELSDNFLYAYNCLGEPLERCIDVRFTDWAVPNCFFLAGVTSRFIKAMMKLFLTC